MNNSPTSSANFPGVLKASRAAAAAVAAPLILSSKSSAAPRGETLKIGLIGCGGRGTGAVVDAMHADKDTVLTAVADIYPENAQDAVNKVREVKELSERVQVPKEQIFIGLDAYKAVMQTDVDLVILTTPPGFRPEHFKAAVAAGKHAFLEKPVATDAPGVRSVIQSVAESKKKNLGVGVGFCWRYNKAEQALYERILAGDIGDIRTLHTSYNTGPLWDRTNPNDTTALQKQLRNWYYYTWLSGDHLVEQAVHVVDWMCWAMGDTPPLKCIGLGGRQVRTEERFGNIYDHFEIAYDYPNGAKGFVYCRQQAGCASDYSGTYYGTKGTAIDKGFGAPPAILNLKGERVWRYEGDRPNMFELEHEALFRSIRDGKPLNAGDRMVNSTMTAIMGRMAAYTGQEITYEAALNSQEQLVPAGLTWDTPAPEVNVPMPGQTRFI
jgi:myo-inositol 2-dehydrogenase / D-chiro-inositol 1-dehydrogenase